jgi:hypothetical protein
MSVDGGAIVEEIQKEKSLGNGYQRCLVKAMDRTHQLLHEDDAALDYDKIHAVKSILYAAIERAGMESDRLVSAQDLLRELLTLVALQVDPVRHERKEAFKILEKLKTHIFQGEKALLNFRSQI